eukprot:2351411-Lingulodinium_polyedra.AAC.1
MSGGRRRARGPRAAPGTAALGPPRRGAPLLVTPTAPAVPPPAGSPRRRPLRASAIARGPP